MWKFGLLGMFSYVIYFIALLFLILLLLGKLIAAIWPWLLVIAVGVGIYVAARRHQKSKK